MAKRIFTEEQRQSNRERSKKWRKANPERARLSSKKYRDKNGNTPWPAKRANGLEVEALKANPCSDCGGRFPRECMDFDHRTDEIKVNNVGTMVSHGWSREKIMTEISKCDLVCANCHRIRTRKRMSLAIT